MHLLNVKTIKLEMFMGTRIPEYAILSHTWGNGEPSFQDMKRGIADQKAGFTKLKFTCAQAAGEDLSYARVDTVCIDKSSSAELSEAINSMYKWSQEAKICYAYLADVPGKAFEQSRWFTRGWTLQELIAPSVVVFYSSDWSRMATKSDLRKKISTITAISADALNGLPLDRLSVAQRMSWASKRTTTRVEDLAYSLLGIFGVNMALLYGEGERAFIRLQEEIMKDSDDQSIFAWKSGPPAPATNGGLLATAPSQFASSGKMIRYQDTSSTSIPYAMTNKGLRMAIKLVQIRDELLYAGLLECQATNDLDRPPAIYLQRLFTVGDQFVRVFPTEIKQMDSSFFSKLETIYVRQKELKPPQESVKDQAFLVQLESSRFKFKDALSITGGRIPYPSFSRGYPIPKGSNGWVALIKFIYDGPPVYDTFYLLLGFTSDRGVSVRLCPNHLGWPPREIFAHYSPRGSSVLERVFPHYLHGFESNQITEVYKKIFVELESRTRSGMRLHFVSLRMQDIG